MQDPKAGRGTLTDGAAADDAMGQPSQASHGVKRNIDTVLRLEEEALQRRTTADRFANLIAGFVGSLSFVLLHLVWFGLWAAINLRLIGLGRPFDPYPFQLLTMIVAMEGVLLTAFVLIKQSRQGELADRRAHLDLQVNLLTEHEVTRLLRLNLRLARKLGIQDEEHTDRELAEVTEVEGLVNSLNDRMTRTTE